jgi:sarcosine/dimethylglycine N-methyltransferase
VDAGAGTGFHSLLLALLGVRVTAVDLSADMLAIARAHADSMGLEVATAQGSLLDLEKLVARGVTAVVCMGNTLAHFTGPGSREKALSQFHAVLAPGGVLLAQALNFDAIMKRETHSQSVKEAGGLRFVREYVPAGDGVEFRITRTALSGDGPRETVSKMLLAPVYADKLVLALSSAGFEDIRLYGSIALDEFSAESSRDLVVICRRT